MLVFDGISVVKEHHNTMVMDTIVQIILGRSQIFLNYSHLLVVMFYELCDLS